MPEEETPEYGPPEQPEGDSEALQAQMEAFRTQLAATTQERDAALAERDAALATHAELQGQLQAHQTRALQAHRRAILAENAGSMVPELVQGSTPEELEASIAAARAVYARVVESVRGQLEAERTALPFVPPGASPRLETPMEELSPIQKIAAALSQRGNRQ